VTQLPLSEPAETVIDEPAGCTAELDGAAGGADLSAIAARWPHCLRAWAALGEAAATEDRTVEAYAYFRVGYHRGLDRIRAAGWRGSGRVPWSHVGNRGFLRSLAGLGRMAAKLGESDEASRCFDFLNTLAPDAPEDLRG
jgi:hypothetical protein